MVFDEVGRIDRLAIYPVKGAAGIEVPYARLEKSGLRFESYRDHEFMVVRSEPDSDGAHNFVSQRDKRSRYDKAQGLRVMASIKPVFHEGGLHLTWNYCDYLELNDGVNNGSELTVRVQKHVCNAVDQGDVYAQWLSDHLETPVRLVKAAGSFRRMSDQDYMENHNPLLFQDGYPLHWIAQSAVRELSKVAGFDVPWQTFRPQVVIEGMELYDEHAVEFGLLNGIKIVNPKPCGRCSVIQIDQDNGEFHPNSPLTVLDRYKRWQDRYEKWLTIFGENTLPLGEGTIGFGDNLITTSYRNPRLKYGSCKRTI